jgi:dTDP-4-amino-4,6-dideoxygalactose transaminase
MEKILQVAREHDLFVIEDACQAIGSDYTFSDGTVKKAGTMGDIGTTSYFPSKNLGCYGDGGSIFTHNDELAAKLRYVVNHGMARRYFHDEIGVNSRLDSIQAAVLDIKLKHLDEYAMARRKAGDLYDSHFSGIPQLQIPVRSTNSTHVFHQYTLVTKDIDRDKLLGHLQSKNIPCAIYYPVPMHLQKAYAGDRYKEGDLPVTEDLSRRVISLPMHTELDKEQIAFIAGAVVDFVSTGT